MKTKKEKKIIPVFFASDENYMPFLGVTLKSLLAHVNAEYEYRIHVLYTGKLSDNAKAVCGMARENVKVYFKEVSRNIDRIKRLIRCRDYYTSAIYFRLFIPELFPEYEKAVYLDCDTILCEDVAKLYETELGENYIGAVADQVITSNPTFGEYTRFALGIEPRKYFNSGVIVMNLAKMREIGFCNLFGQVLSSYDFIVAPDQDCLNLICKNKVVYLSMDWNRMPIAGKKVGAPKLVHYNLSMKPWHYDGVLYEKLFWDTAKQTPFYDFIQKKKESFTSEMAEKDAADGANLLALAQAEADSPYNYYRTVILGINQEQKMKNEVGRYGFNGNFRGTAEGIKAD